MLKVSQQAVTALSVDHDRRLLDRVAVGLAQAIAGEPGRVLGIAPATARDHARIVDVVRLGVDAGLRGEVDLFAFGLFNIHPDVRFPTDVHDWIVATLGAGHAPWIDRLSAVRALLPESWRRLMFPASMAPA